MEQPLYLQVKEGLMEMISSQESNTAIPSERELSKLFHVSRMTLRKAVTELVEEGVLYRDKTRGTFVSDRNLKKKNTFFDRTPVRHLLYMTRRNFKEIAPLLDLPAYEDIIRIVTRNDLGDRLAHIDEIYIWKQRFIDDYKDLDAFFDAIYDSSQYHIYKKFYPMHVPVQFVSLMNIPMETPIIMVESLYKSKTGQPILLMKTYYNPEVETIEISN